MVSLWLNPAFIRITQIPCNPGERSVVLLIAKMASKGFQRTACYRPFSPSGFLLEGFRNGHSSGPKKLTPYYVSDLVFVNKDLGRSSWIGRRRSVSAKSTKG